MAVYILEFDRPLGNLSNPHGSAKFYIGWTTDNNVEKRITAHRTGKGAFITAAAVAQGITLKHVATLPGDRTLERQLKNMKDAPGLVRKLRAGKLPKGVPQPLFIQ